MEWKVPAQIRVDAMIAGKLSLSSSPLAGCRGNPHPHSHPQQVTEVPIFKSEMESYFVTPAPFLRLSRLLSETTLWGNL